MDNDAKLISNRLYKFIEDKNLTINRLATLSGINQSSVNNLFDGSTKSPKIATVKALCDGLNISVKDFFDFPPYNQVEKWNLIQIVLEIYY